MTDHTAPAYFVDGGHRTRAEARKLAGELLAFAGHERAGTLILTDEGCDTLKFRGSAVDRNLVLANINAAAVYLDPAQIDQLITWLQGHREDNP